MIIKLHVLTNRLLEMKLQFAFSSDHPNCWKAFYCNLTQYSERTFQFWHCTEFGDTRLNKQIP